jgi:diketogulonate reductase-like aldo/keto reductase
VPIPKSSNEQRIVENISIFDFELTNEEMQFMDGFNTGLRTVPFNACKSHKYFMFGIEF